MTNILLLFAAGVTVGALTMVVLQVGVPKSDFSKGIRGIVDQSMQSEVDSTQEQTSDTVDTSDEQPNTYDFYTVLPEVEVLIPEDYREIVAKPFNSNDQQQTDDQSAKTKTEVASPPSPPQKPASSDRTHFILQAASFKKQSDAEQLRARLALLGLASNIQKVSIQDRGDFYRVRLGPFSAYEEMLNADQILKGEGIKPLRLKVSKK